MGAADREGRAHAAGCERGRRVVSDGLQPGNKINNLDELDMFVKEVVASEPTKQFIIKADKNIQYSAFNVVYEKLRINNCRRIALLTEAKPETGPR